MQQAMYEVEVPAGVFSGNAFQAQIAGQLMVSAKQSRRRPEKCLAACALACLDAALQRRLGVTKIT